MVETLEYAKTNLLLQKEAYDNFLLMAKDIEKENMHIRIVSAYRSFEYQKNLYNNYLKHNLFFLLKIHHLLILFQCLLMIDFVLILEPLLL